MPETSPLSCVIVPVTAFQQNCSIVWCTETMEGAVVDPGGETERLILATREHGITVTKVLVTHGHLDHCGAAAELAAELGVPIEGPQREDAFWIDALEHDGQKYGMTWARGFTPDRWLEDRDTVSLGKLTLDVRHCPGHTPGHVVFHHAGAQIAFVGDVLFQGSVGRTDFPRGDHSLLIQSIVTRMWPMGDDTVFVPGHGPISTFGHERRSNPFVADRVLARA